VLFVLTDDMRLDDLQYMPQVRQLVGDEGATFDNEFDNVTLCCPARTSILRGQYSHNTGVLTNGGTTGGFETAHAIKVEDATVATAMHNAGYVTGLFGKYLNGYPNTVAPSYVPPGWDTWSSSSKGNAYGEFNYTLNQNGTQVHYGDKPEDYGTDVYTRQTTDFIDHSHDAGKPFFAYLAVYAPHQPATPAPQDADSFPGLQATRDASYDEADVSDKPQYIQDLSPVGRQAQAKVDALARRRAQSLQAVDRDVAGLVAHLRGIGVLDNTYIIFTSDNGFHLGQHRMPAGKQTAYETDIHLPLLVRGPGVTAGDHVQAITGNVDLAPTIAELGGAKLADSPDGRSLVAFLHGRAPDAADWRQAYLLEHWTTSLVPQDDRDPRNSNPTTWTRRAPVTARRRPRPRSAPARPRGPTSPNSRDCASTGTPTSSTRPARRSSTTSPRIPTSSTTSPPPLLLRCSRPSTNGSTTCGRARVTAAAPPRTSRSTFPTDTRAPETCQLSSSGIHERGVLMPRLPSRALTVVGCIAMLALCACSSGGRKASDASRGPASTAASGETTTSRPRDRPRSCRRN